MNRLQRLANTVPACPNVNRVVVGRRRSSSGFCAAPGAALRQRQCAARCPPADSCAKRRIRQPGAGFRRESPSDRSGLIFGSSPCALKPHRMPVGLARLRAARSAPCRRASRRRKAPVCERRSPWRRRCGRSFRNPACVPVTSPAFFTSCSRRRCWSWCPISRRHWPPAGPRRR